MWNKCLICGKEILPIEGKRTKTRALKMKFCGIQCSKQHLTSIAQELLDCPKCGSKIPSANLKRHLAHCSGVPTTQKKLRKSSAYELVGDKYKCPYCDKLYCKHGITTHIWRVHEGGVAFKPSKGKSAWNKGSTKESDYRVLAGSKALSATLRNKVATGNWDASVMSPEKRQELSLKMSKHNTGGRSTVELLGII